MCDVLAVDYDAATARLDQAENRRKDARLARSGAAHDANLRMHPNELMAAQTCTLLCEHRIPFGHSGSKSSDHAELSEARRGTCK